MKKFKYIAQTLMLLLALIGTGIILWFSFETDLNRYERCMSTSDERDSLYLENIRLKNIIEKFSQNNPEFDLIDAVNESKKIKYK
jgi:hypothetical protein